MRPFLRPLRDDGGGPAGPVAGQEMAMPAPRKKTWDATLREVIKTEHGFGWSIRGHRGKVQLTRRFEDGSRSSVSIDLAWNASCQSDVIQTLVEIRQRMDAQGLGLRVR